MDHKEVMHDALVILNRYKSDVPLGHHPHMMAHKLDEVVQSLHQAIKELDEQEAVAIVRDDFPSRIAWMSEPPDFTELYTHPSPSRELSDVRDAIDKAMEGDMK